MSEGLRVFCSRSDEAAIVQHWATGSGRELTSVASRDHSSQRVTPTGWRQALSSASVLLEQELDGRGFNSEVLIVESFVHCNSDSHACMQACIVLLGSNLRRFFRRFTCSEPLKNSDGIASLENMMMSLPAEELLGKYENTDTSFLETLLDDVTSSRNKLSGLNNSLKPYENFPTQGQAFYDMFALTAKPTGPSDLVQMMLEQTQARLHSIELKDVFIAGLDMRGVMLGFALATCMGVPFVPLRKPGKLPGNVLSKSYTKEYGEDTFQVQTEYIDSFGQHAIVVDDILATGGSMEAACELIERIGKSVAMVLVAADVPVLRPMWSEKLKARHIAVCL